ncbi:hypothetical protein SLEP1_g53437 [Rubroshorea leprosula]|uniref:Secreted protein n=1 Tax=Rubroshorea leprosula TaxID=152421 RepID=A0AAV5MAD0_9ROSI|nr:hypothetical protein SLEP1_g53437 [Rubroshorea leprosula]
MLRVFLFFLSPTPNKSPSHHRRPHLRETESQICSALLLPATALLCGANCSSFCAASPLQIVVGFPPNCSSGFACKILVLECSVTRILGLSFGFEKKT